MKKSLSAILATSMVASMFASVAFAAEAPKTAQEMFDVLKTKGIFEGINDAGDAGLDQKMNRAQVSKILVKLMGLTEDEAGAAGYKDLTVQTWAKGFIGAATKAGLMEGTAVGAFDPAGTFTTEQLATVMVRALKLPETTDAVEGKVSDWAKGYVAAAVKAGLIAKSADYSAPALREVLVTTSFQAYTKIEDAKKPVVTAGAKVVGAKKIEVTFAAAVDTTKATIEVKKGTFPVNIAKTSWNDAKTVATVELAANLTKGDYTVNVGGVVEPAYTKTLTVEDAKVASIEFTSEKAPLVRGDNTKVTIGFKMKNQYGEDVTDKYTSVTFTAGKGAITASKGSIELDADTEFRLDEKVAVSALYSDGAANQVFAQSVVTVASEAQVKELSIAKVAHKTDGSKTLDVNSNATEYVLVLNAKDQYGNTATADLLKADLSVSVSNNTIAQFKSTTVGTTVYGEFAKQKVQSDDNQLVLELANGTGGNLKAGSTTFYMYSKTTGATANFEVKVADKAKVDTFTMDQPAIAVAGEEIEIPFTAVDQFGKEMTKDTDLTGGFTYLNVTGPTGTELNFKQDYVNGKAKLILDTKKNSVVVDKATNVYIYALTSTAKAVNLTISLQPNAKASVISGVSEVKAAVVQGAKTTLKHDKVSVVDQYGRTKTLKDFLAGYKATVEVTSGSDKVTSSATELATATTSTDLTAVADKDGTAEVTLKLVKLSDSKVVEGSDFKFSVKNVKKSDLTGFEVADITKAYAGGSDYEKAIDVTGLLSDGSKVALDPSDRTVYSVTYSSDLTFNTVTSKVYAPVGLDLGGANKEKSYTITVTGFAKDKPVVVSKEIIVSNVAPAAEKLEYRTSGVATKESDGVISVASFTAGTLNAVAIANAAVKVVDQYGVEITTSKFSNVYTSNFNNSKTAATVGAAGDTFQITAVTANNKTVNFKVIVK